MLPRPDFPKTHAVAGQPLRILLIEDDPISVEIVGSYLKRIDFTRAELHSSATLAGALELLAQREIDLVISDLHLPDAAGAATIAALVKVVACPVIAITSDSEPTLRDETLAAGAYEFLHKRGLSEAVLSRLVRLAAMQASTFRSLRDSEARFRSLSTLTSDWFWETDEEHRFVQTATRITSVTGMPPSQYVGRARWEVPGLRPLTGDWKQHREALARRESFRDLEVVQERPDGKRFYLQISGEPVHNAAGAFIGYHGTAKNITEQKRAETALRQSEAWFRQTFELAGSGMAHVALDGRFLRVNRKLCEILGYTEAGLVGRSVKEISHPEDRDVTDAQRARMREGEVAAVKAEKRYLRSDGKVVWVELTVALAHDEHGEPLYEITIVDDITQRKSADAALSESEERFRSLTELSSDFYWETDPQHRLAVMIPGANHAPLDSSGAQIGKTRWEVASTRPDEAGWAAHRALLAARLPFRDFEVGRRDAGGREQHFSVSGEPVFDSRGAFAGYRGTGREITERKREEAILALEHAVTLHLAAAPSAAAGLEAVLRAICESQGWPVGRYFIADDPAGVLRFVAAWGQPLPAVQEMIEESRNMVYERGRGLSGHVWATGEPLWVKEVSRDRRASGSVRGKLEGGAFVFPITAGGETLGVMSFSSKHERDPDQRLLRAIGVIGSQVGQFLMRKAAEQKERRRAGDLERFRAALDAAADAVLLIDARSGAYLDLNEAACATFGYAREEMLAMSADQMRVDQPRERLLAAYQRLAADPDGDQLEIAACRRKDGSVLPVEFSLRVLRTGEGPIVVATARDLTERLKAEERQAVLLKYQERAARFSQAALAQREPGDLVEKAVQEVLEALDAEAVAYVEREPGSAELVIRSLVGVAGPFHPGVVPAAGDSPLLDAMTANTRRVIDGAHLPFPWARNLRSTALLPVRGESGVRGLLCVGYKSSGAFAIEELNFAEAVASVLSTGLVRIDSESRVAYLAQFDPLTGLPNRTLLADRFSQMIMHAQRREAPLAVLFIDLDGFKLVNDTLGHAGGDALLKEVAARLQAAVRPGDTVARISGDEFAVVLADMARLEDAALVAQKIIDKLGATVEITGKEVFVTASVGIAVYPGDGADAETLIGAADAAMYRAKQSGRNTFHFYTAEINQRSRARAQLGGELRRALEREEFVLFYQPKVDLATREIIGAEALMRWKHPQRGMVSPMEFIPVLEETGLIGPAGDWALRRACEDLKGWRAAGHGVVPVAVNLSARQFRRADLDTHFLSLVTAAGIDPKLIELEITESQLMHDPQHAIRVMRALRDAGMTIAVDDFGTGYSSLAYLNRFPINALKIDRSFIKDMATGKDHAVIARTIIEMAHSLGFTVVAEGVETEEQATFLRLLRCERAQGFLFAKPMPAAELARLLPRP